MRSRLRSRLPWIILAATLLLTVVAAAFVWRLRRAVAEARFANAVQSTTDRITSRLEVYSAVLRAGAAFYSASSSVTADDFRRFAGRLDLQSRFPGIQGIGWTERIAWNPDSVPDERHAIRFLEPLDDRNRAAIGFDMYADSTRQQAMQRARDEARPALSGRVTLVQEIRGPRQAGFLIYVPVFSTREPPTTVEARRENLRGFVYGAFRADDLFAGIFGSEAEPRVSFIVHDGPIPDSTHILHTSSGPRDEGFLRAMVPLQVSGRTWTVDFRSQPAIEQGLGTNLVWVVLLTGLGVSAIIGWLAFAQARAREAAEHANRAKSDFLAIMSHELRTPLNAIGGYAELLEMGIHGPVTTAQQDAIRRMRKAKDHLLGLINNVLNYARIEAGRVEFSARRVTIGELVAAVDDMTAPQARARGVEFHALVAEPQTEVIADPEKAQQVLLNLASNAVKFTEPGGHVSIDTRLEDDAVHVEVRDSGIGIPPDKLRSIFDPFVQVDASLTRGVSGTGLGLAISRDLARAMGGDVSAQSTPGKGSIFTFRLPRAAADRD